MKVKIYNNKFAIISERTEGLIDKKTFGIFVNHDPKFELEHIRQVDLDVDKELIQEVEINPHIRAQILVDLAFAFGKFPDEFIERCKHFEIFPKG